MVLRIWGKKTLRLKLSNQGLSSRGCFAAKPGGFVSFFSACASPIQIILMIKINKLIEAAVNLKSFYLLPIFTHNTITSITCNCVWSSQAFYQKENFRKLEFYVDLSKKAVKQVKKQLFLPLADLGKCRKAANFAKKIEFAPNFFSKSTNFLFSILADGQATPTIFCGSKNRNPMINVAQKSQRSRQICLIQMEAPYY